MPINTKIIEISKKILNSNGNMHDRVEKVIEPYNLSDDELSQLGFELITDVISIFCQLKIMRGIKTRKSQGYK